MRRNLCSRVAVLTVNLHLTSVKLVREWHGLFRTISDVGDVVTEPEKSNEEYNGSYSTYNGTAYLNPHVESA